MRIGVALVTHHARIMRFPSYEVKRFFYCVRLSQLFRASLVRFETKSHFRDAYTFRMLRSFPRLTLFWKPPLLPPNRYLLGSLSRVRRLREL